MNATTLTPHKGKKQKYALKSFLWGILIAALFIVPSLIIDRGRYLYSDDFNNQIIPFYQLMSSAIKNGEFGWNWYTDLGTSFVGGYSYYSLGSPFFWIMVPFPVDWIPYLLGPITILKIGLSSLTAYVFLKRYTKDKNNAVIGAMLYAFSGFAVSSISFGFSDNLVFFPLLLSALDSFIYEDKRGKFAFIAAVCAIVNYYFFAAEIMFCLIYWIVRTATKSYRISVSKSLQLFFEAILGTGMAMTILLPSLYHFVGNAIGNDKGMNGWNYYIYESLYSYAQIVISFFLPPETVSGNVYLAEENNKWLSVTGYLPLFSMSGVFAVIFNKHRNKWLRVFYAVCTVFMFVPVFNSFFQLFIEYRYMRWLFMLMLVMSLGSVMALEDSSAKWKKAVVTNLVGVIIVTLIIGFTPNSGKGLGIMCNSAQFWLLAVIAFLNIALCVLFLKLYKHKRDAFKRFGALIVSSAIILVTASNYGILKVQSYKDYGIYETNLINGGDEIHIDDIQNWRTDVVNLADYSELMYDEEHIGNLTNAQIEEINLNAVRSIGSGRDSFIVDNENTTMYWRIPGVQCIHENVSSSISDFYNALGFSRENSSNLPMSLYGARSFLSVKYMMNYSGTDYKVTDKNSDFIMPGWKYYDTQNGYDIYENKYVLPIGFTFDSFIVNTEFEKIPEQYRHLVLTDSLVVDSIDNMFECVGAGMAQRSMSELSFTQEDYFKNCEARKNNACYDFKRDKKGFEAKIDVEKDDNFEYRMVFFSVPYDKGWSAKVNDEKADIINVDYGFMAVKVPTGGTSTIRFNYHTSGIIYGTFVGVVCLVLLVIYLAAIKIQSTPNEEEESDDKSADDKSENENNTENADNSNSCDSSKTHDNTENAESPDNTESQPEFEEDISIFDIVKQTEEQNMMHVYKRVPVVLESGFGSVAYDINQKKYIDFTSGIGVNALGFANGTWSDAVEKQLDLVQHTSNIYYSKTQISLAQKLCKATGFSKVFFANSGAEANECAIKLARKYGSDKYGENHTHIVTLENSFHGRTITTLAATGQEAFHKYFTPFTKGFSYAKANDMESIKSAVTENTCAVMIELIQGEGGVNPLDREFVTALAEFCQANDILLIVDEIQTGIGRTGKLFCYENYGITPDVITSAKALGGGLPLSACLCSEKLKDVLTPGTNGTTFGGNAIACAGAEKILDIVSDEEFLKDVRRKGKYMRNRIKAVSGVKEVRGMGLMIGIVLEKNNAAEIQEKCAENGLLVLTAKNLIRLLPPLNIEYEDIDEGLDILERTINDNKE